MADSNSEKDRKKEEEKTVEQNLSAGYIPKSKLGNLPMANELDKEVVKQMDKTKADIEKLKKDLVKQYKFIESIGIVPAQASQKIEEEYEVPEADCKRKLIHLLVVVPEDKFKEIQKIRLECIKKAKDINDKIWMHIMTPVDIWNLGLDSKFDVFEALAMSYPILDKGLLGALRVSSIHKSLVLRKFEKYVSAYVIGGSLVRGTTKPTSDVDVFIIIDDTDVKRMPRFELKEKLRSVIFQYIQEATAIAGVKNLLSPQVYLMTEFWEAVKDAHPVMFTFIRDGIPLYDRGAFLPWKSLLKMGKIKASRESLDMFMSTGDRLEDNINRRLLDIVTMDIFTGVSYPTQGLLMLYGRAPGNVYDTVKEFRELFVEKEKLIEKKYADILEEISIKYYKGMEHGKIKKVSGSEVERVAKDAIDYIKRLKQLREQIEKRMQDKSIAQVYGDVFGMIGSLLGKSGESAIIKAFDDEFVKQGKMPPRFSENLKFIIKTKKDFEAFDKDKKKKVTAKEITAMEDVRKMAAEITNVMIEYVQRKDFVAMDRKRFVLKTAEKLVEVFFLKSVYVVDAGKVFVLRGEKLVDSNVDDLNKALSDSKADTVKIVPEVMGIFKKIYGDFELGN
jgi:predicted nucleotidyltransferase